MRHRKPSTPPHDAGASLLHEHRRLRRAFAALLVAVAPVTLAQACSAPSSTEPDAGPGMDAGVDTGLDVTVDVHADAALDGVGEADGDAADGGADGGSDARDCTMSIGLFDAGDASIDGEPGCSYTFPCGVPDGLLYVGCDVYIGPTSLGCSLVPEAGCLADAYAPGPDGLVIMSCNECLGGGGRRPHGLLRARAICAPTPEGAYFARMAHDEAASVHAFARMRDELAAHGAPSPLRRAAERSTRDEVRHARAMARHARMLGAPVVAPRVRRSTIRTLASIARENAVEGCVNETFGALIAAFQAAHAPRASIRRTFARIAADEARHAALSWAVARWAERRLDPAARARVAAARARAIRALRRQVSASPFDAAVGRPTPAQRAQLLEGMLLELISPDHSSRGAG